MRVTLPRERPGRGPLTTTMEHCRCQNHHDAPSSWLRRPGTGRRLGAGDTGATGDAGEACDCRSATRRAGYQPPGSAERAPDPSLHSETAAPIRHTGPRKRSRRRCGPRRSAGSGASDQAPFGIPVAGRATKPRLVSRSSGRGWYGPQRWQPSRPPSGANTERSYVLT
jgi:hypothetical protein